MSENHTSVSVDVHRKSHCPSALAAWRGSFRLKATCWQSVFIRLQTFNNLSESHCNYLHKGCNTVINSKCATPSSSGHSFCFADVRRTASWWTPAVSSHWIMRQLHRADCVQRLRWAVTVFPEYFIYLIKHWYLVSGTVYCAVALPSLPPRPFLLLGSSLEEVADKNWRAVRLAAFHLPIHRKHCSLHWF